MVRRLLSTLFPVLILGAGLLHAQGEVLNLYLDRGRALSKAEKLDQALPYFLFALELGEKQFGADSPSVVRLLNDLAETYATRSDYSDAEPLFERALEIQEGEAARYRSGIARTLNQLGSIYEATARPDEARRAYTRVLASLQPGLGAGDPSVQTARRRLAKLEHLPPPPIVAATPPAPAAAAEFSVHLSSVRRTGEAAPEWHRLQQIYPKLLGGLGLAVARVDLGAARGVWFRVLGGPLERAEARARCAAFTGRGVWCAVRRGGAAPAQVQVAAETPTPPAPPPPAAEPGDYRIHLTSIRNAGDAQDEWARLRRRFKALLADLGLTVTRADLGAGRGVWHRIQGGPLARAQARARCAAFAGRKQWCRVVPPPGNSAEGSQRYLALRVRRRGPATVRGTRRPGPAPRPAPTRAPRPAPEPGARRFSEATFCRFR